MKSPILYVVSTGVAGASLDSLSEQARLAIEQAQAIISYDKYAKDLANLLRDKEVHTSGMTKEIERCNLALDLAMQKDCVAILSNGDVNVYGMSSLVHELALQRNLLEKIEIIPIAGITSFLAAAAKIGAPVSQDFAIISLSDRLTPIEKIQKRIALSLQADFVLGIYNPLSRSRHLPFDFFIKQLELVSNRPVAVAKNLGRNSQEIMLLESCDFVKNWQDYNIDMSTVLLIANSSAYFISALTKTGIEKKILTPRGYLNKYDIEGRRKH